jgi:hypothetical protein
MHLLKFLSSTLLAGIAATSPLASGKTSLERRATSDGQAGANIDAAKGIELTFVQGSKTYQISYKNCRLIVVVHHSGSPTTIIPLLRTPCCDNEFCSRNGNLHG